MMHGYSLRSLYFSVSLSYGPVGGHLSHHLMFAEHLLSPQENRRESMNKKVQSQVGAKRL